jgi:hypothetical protein
VGRREPRAILTVAILSSFALLAVGCRPDPAPSALASIALATPPGISEISAVGTILDYSQAGPNIDFRLRDGRSLSFDLSIVRMVARGAGDPILLVSGRDAAGPWVAVIGHPAGTPAGCHTLDQPGDDLGASIAIAGIRWPKAPALAATNVVPGQSYPPSTRFCLDDLGRVNGILTS